MIEHAGLVNYVCYAADRFRVSEGDVAPINTSISFDATITALYPPLIVGKTIRLLPPNDMIDGLAEVIRNNKSTSLIKITPSHLEALQAVHSIDEFRGVNAIVLGGEALRSSTIKSWQERMPNTRIFNHYGPTETVVGAIVYEAVGQSGHANIPIGKPIWNKKVYVLDENLEPVPPGVIGELYIGGVGVARGYWRQPGLTASKFVANPFRVGERMYCTGDLVRYRADGNVEFLGRNDSQIKLRGYRIELGEIEETLRRQEGVQHVAVALREDTITGKHIVAYVVSKKVTTEDVFLYARQVLPTYMIPQTIMIVDEIPLTKNGKIDYKALPAPNLNSEAKEIELPRSSIEQRVARVWSEVLGIDKIGRKENLFALGAHSLLVLRVASNLAAELSMKVPIPMLFEAQSIADVAERLESIATLAANSQSENEVIYDEGVV